MKKNESNPWASDLGLHYVPQKGRKASMPRLTLYKLGNSSCLCCRLSTSKLTFSKKYVQEHYKCVKRFGFGSGPTERRS